MALALAFGTMLAVTLGILIWGSLYTAGENTRQLLTARINLTLDAVENGVRDYLLPVEREMFSLREKFQSGDLPADLDHPQTASFIGGLLTASNQVEGIGILQRDGSFSYRERHGGSVFFEEGFEPGEEAALFDGSDAEDRVVWGTPVWSPAINDTYINARLRLDFGDGKERLLLVGIELGSFVRGVTELSVQIGQPVFALHGGEWILAFNGFDVARAGLSEDRPLAHVSEASDPVLAAFAKGQPDRLRDVAPDVDASGMRVDVGDVGHAIIYREVEGFTDLAWTIGTHLPADEAAEQIRRFFGLFFLSIGVSLAAIAATIWIGRRLSRPVERLAGFAQRVGNLEFEKLEPLPSSSIRELHTASQAFNHMAGALRWFETYVPRRLVRQLIRSHGDKGVPSSERDVTVMFSDIVGFTRRTTGMPPGEVAAFLNRHFATLKDCIEAEGGTIDKYIGDSVMAFWGAPERQPDHAERACRAALAIRAALEADSDAPSIRIGIQSGTTLVGNIGAPGRFNYTLVGDTVNLAQRLEQLGKTQQPAGKTTILISAPTRERTDPAAFPSEDLGDMPIAGTTMTARIYRL
ncbi:MAG: adenylate/guanylate cyclase domain-containing protein [Geminicoccaceae bacterium]